MEIVNRLRKKHPHYRFSMDFDHCDLLERYDRVENVGYMRIENIMTKRWDIVSFDYNKSKDSFSIDGDDPDSYFPRLGALPQNGIKIDYEKLNRIKSKNNGMIMPDMTAEQLIEKVNNTHVFVAAVKLEFEDLIRREYNRCKNINHGTEFICKLHYSDPWYYPFIELRVMCNAIIKDRKIFNMHFNDVTKMLYKTTILGIPDKTNHRILVEFKQSS